MTAHISLLNVKITVRRSHECIEQASASMPPLNFHHGQNSNLSLYHNTPLPSERDGTLIVTAQCGVKGPG